MNTAVIANILTGIVIVGTVLTFAYSVKSDVAILQTSFNIKFEYVTRDIQELKDFVLPHSRSTQPPK